MIQIPYFTTTFFIKLDSILPFLYTLLLSALIRITICKHQDNPWSLGLTETQHFSTPQLLFCSFFRKVLYRFPILFDIQVCFCTLCLPPTNSANQRDGLIATLTFLYFHATHFLYWQSKKKTQSLQDRRKKLPNSVCHTQRYALNFNSNVLTPRENFRYIHAHTHTDSKKPWTFMFKEKVPTWNELTQ